MTDVIPRNRDPLEIQFYKEIEDQYQLSVTTFAKMLREPQIKSESLNTAFETLMEFQGLRD